MKRIMHGAALRLLSRRGARHFEHAVEDVALAQEVQA
jgi:hypothetical protein